MRWLGSLMPHARGARLPCMIAHRMQLPGKLLVRHAGHALCPAYDALGIMAPSNARNLLQCIHNTDPLMITSSFNLAAVVCSCMAGLGLAANSWATATAWTPSGMMSIKRYSIDVARYLGLLVCCKLRQATPRTASKLHASQT